GTSTGLLRHYTTFASHDSRRHLRSFPTRRSSDLEQRQPPGLIGSRARQALTGEPQHRRRGQRVDRQAMLVVADLEAAAIGIEARSEEHTSELQSRETLVCRLLLATTKRSSAAGRS